MNNDFTCDIGYKSINHDGEQLCGDHVMSARYGENSHVVVLADGLKSGVKASILSTLTSTIISTMMAKGLPIEECVDTIAATLPVDQEKHIAYSTFTILHIVENKTAELIQYENPPAIFLRNGKSFNYPKKELEIGGKKILYTKLNLREKDTFVLMSDGCPNASTGLTYNYNWQVKDIAQFMEIYCELGYTARTLASMLVDECDRQYGFHPIDDVTACVVRMKPRRHVNMLFDSPSDPAMAPAMIDAFRQSPGVHILSGGAIAETTAEYLGKPLKLLPQTASDNIPPIMELSSMDLVTEGIITLNKVVEYAEEFLGDNKLYSEWGFHRDAASLISRHLFEDATDIHLFVGKAIDPYYIEKGLDISHSFRLHQMEKLISALKEMGKNVVVTYY